VRADSNLSTFRKKSSPVARNFDRAILKSKCVITERDLASVSEMLDELRSFADRFDVLRWQIVHRGCRR
jgi:hypothetical protein